MQEPQQPKRKRGTKYSGDSKTKPKGTEPTERQRETMFGGVRGNIPGQTSEARKAAIEAGELAQIAMAAWLRDLVNKVNADPDNALSHLDNTRLALVNSAQDRSFGKATTSVDVTSKGESVAPKSMSDFYAMTKEEDSD